MFAGFIVGGAVCVAVAVHAAEYNFHEQSGESIIAERGQDACARAQRARDDACRAVTECDLDKQERTIEKYKEVKERLACGDINDSDKARLEETIRDLERDLDARKDGAETSMPTRTVPSAVSRSPSGAGVVGRRLVSR